MEYIIISCPHCDVQILIYLKELNCRIFRHGYYIKKLEQINPHLPKDQCEELINNKKIIGCGKPFKIINYDKEYKEIIFYYIKY